MEEQIRKNNGIIVNMSGKKKYHKNSITGQKGVNLIEQVVLDIGFVWHPANLDAGIDGYIEIRDTVTGDATNFIIQVQSKASENYFKSETQTTFDFFCKERDIQYWLKGNSPVILICSDINTKQSYWVNIKQYFNDPIKVKSKKVTFDKNKDVFDNSCKDKLFDIAIPVNSGFYFTPPPVKETLISNLLPLAKLPDKIYRSKTKYRDARKLWKDLLELSDRSNNINKAWILHNSEIYTFNNLNDAPWNNIFNNEIHIIDTSEWSQSYDIDTKRSFVKLLNYTFQDFAFHRNLFNFKFDKFDLYYVKPTFDDQGLPRSRKIPYYAHGRKASQSVCSRHMRKKDPKTISFFRHLAFEKSFKRFNDNWYLEITPTYFFTHDGRKLHTYYESKLKGKKALDKHPVVLSEVLFWAEKLSNPASIFFPELIAFNSLQKLPFTSGINDKLWLEKDNIVSKQDNTSNSQNLLFDN